MSLGKNLLKSFCQIKFNVRYFNRMFAKKSFQDHYSKYNGITDLLRGRHVPLGVRGPPVWKPCPNPSPNPANRMNAASTSVRLTRHLKDAKDGWLISSFSTNTERERRFQNRRQWLSLIRFARYTICSFMAHCCWPATCDRPGWDHPTRPVDAVTFGDSPGSLAFRWRFSGRV